MRRQYTQQSDGTRAPEGVVNAAAVCNTYILRRIEKFGEIVRVGTDVIHRGAGRRDVAGAGWGRLLKTMG